MRKIGSLFNRSSTRSFAVSILVIIFLVGIVLSYYTMLYNEKRSNIIKEGEITASLSAEQFKKYMSTNVHAVSLTAYTLDEMITEKKSDEEIQEYLVVQSTAIRSAVLENLTGLYGYINGRFFSGTRWEPPEGYDATLRPWYKKALEGNGEITILEPYYDIQSGNNMLALGKSLCDGVSVISVDVSLDQFQKLTEEAVADGYSDIEMIIGSNGQVVTHSDVSEVGKIYSDDSDTLGAAVYRNIKNCGDDSLVEFYYNGSHYIVYVAEILDGWYSVSVKNSTKVFTSLAMIFVVTVIIIVLIVIVTSVIVARVNKKGEITDRLNKQLLSVTTIYRSAHDIDVINDTFSEIIIKNKRLSELLAGNVRNAQETLYKIMDSLTADPSKEDMRDFINFSTLDERLDGRNTITLEFLNVEDIWLRGRFIVSQRTADRKLSHILWVVEDINEEKRDREKLIDISQRAIAANEAKSAFLSSMSHEIRTPINAVLGMNEMILRECEDRNILAYSESVKTAGNTLLGLVNDILDFSKIEAGKMEIIPVEYDLSSTLNDIVNMVRSRAMEKGISLKLDFDINMPKKLFGDEVRVKQIVVNMLTNAIKYTEKGSVSFEVKYEKVENSPDYIDLCIAVSDTGIGIKNEDLKKLFKEFERIEEKRNRNIEGTGLGLSIVKSLLDMMGSDLKIETKYGHGSRFSFKLRQRVIEFEPLGDYEAAFARMLEKEKYTQRFSAPEARILVVDDNPMNLLVFKSLLKQTHVRVETAGGGREALLLTSDKKYDLIFFDHMMPEMDGIETFHEMRLQKGGPNETTPAVCLTANAIFGAREQYLSEGFDDYLTKPIDATMLEETLLKYLPENKIEKVYGDIPFLDLADTELSEELEKLKSFSWIDLRAGIKNSGSADSYLALLRIFYNSIEEKIEELKAFYDTGDFKDYTIKVHALKSSARIIGALAFADEAQMLENAGKEDDMDFIKANHDKFINELDSFKEPLSEVLEDKDAQPKEPATEEMIHESFCRLRQSADEMDCDGIFSVFDEMDNYSIPKEHAKLWKQLKSAADNYDYDGILELLEKGYI